jgi:hypothetical protein
MFLIVASIFLIILIIRGVDVLSIGIRDLILYATNFISLFGFFGLTIGFLLGGEDAIKHYTLRLILWWKGYAPFNYAKFLDYATKLIFLRKVGGGYIFIHRMLMEHLAAMRKEEIGTEIT